MVRVRIELCMPIFFGGQCLHWRHNFSVVRNWSMLNHSEHRPQRRTIPISSITAVVPPLLQVPPHMPGFVPPTEHWLLPGPPPSPVAEWLARPALRVLRPCSPVAGSQPIARTSKTPMDDHPRLARAPVRMPLPPERRWSGHTQQPAASFLLNPWVVRREYRSSGRHRRPERPTRQACIP